MIKLKTIITQTNSFKELIESNDYKNADISECVDLENFTILAEWADIDDVYDIIQDGISWYKFVDKNGLTHSIRLTKGVGDRWEIKFWFYDKETGKPNYSKPNIYNNLQYDTKIYNTHLNILMFKLIPYFFKQLPAEILYLPFIDKSRCRLFRIDLNKFLNKKIYEIDLSEENKNIIKITVRKME